MKPLISVIIPVYQVEPYVAHCIESLINQTYKNLEIIVVDDGSDDGSGEICDKYADEDSRIRVIHQENRGLSEARNAGIDIAEGEYLVLIDSDDWVAQRFIEAMYEISTETGCEIVQCNFQSVIDDYVQEDKWEGNYTVYTPKEFATASYTLLSWKCNVAWNKLYKSSLFSGIRYPTGKIHEDEFTTYKLAWKANKIAVTNAKLYFYRQRADSIMGRSYSIKRLDAGEALKEKEIFYQERGESELVDLIRMARLEWLGWNLPLIKSCEDGTGGLAAELELEKELLEKCVKEGIVYKKGLKFHGYLFPFAKVPYGSRIILYGAGDVGTQYYRQIMESNYCDVVAWVDENAKKYKEMGFPVKRKCEINFDCIDAEYIVIGIRSETAARKIIDEYSNDYKQIKVIYEIIKV